METFPTSNRRSHCTLYIKLLLSRIFMQTLCRWKRTFRYRRGWWRKESERRNWRNAEETGPAARATGTLNQIQNYVSNQVQTKRKIKCSIVYKSKLVQSSTWFVHNLHINLRIISVRIFVFCRYLYLCLTFHNFQTNLRINQVFISNTSVWLVPVNQFFNF